MLIFFLFLLSMNTYIIKLFIDTKRQRLNDSNEADPIESNDGTSIEKDAATDALVAEQQRRAVQYRTLWYDRESAGSGW